MRYIGGKSLMLENIEQVIKENAPLSKGRFFDCFSGSGVVSNYFKSKGWQTISNDMMYFSYVLARGTAGVSKTLTFERLGIADPLSWLNGLTLEESGFSLEDCFIYQNYSPNEQCGRMYFQNKNAIRIDVIRLTLEKWKNEGRLSEDEYYYLLASLIAAAPYVSNITGVYGAYLKHWDKRSGNDLLLKEAELVLNGTECPCYHGDIDLLLDQVETDVAYLDTPYNQRQYLPNYHVLETIARYDYPELSGTTGLRGYENEKSDFCVKAKVGAAFERVISGLRARYIVVSYNNEGLMSTQAMLDLLKRYAKRGEVKLYEYPYRRYKNKIPNETEGLKEQIYFIEKG